MFHWVSIQAVRKLIIGTTCVVTGMLAAGEEYAMGSFHPLDSHGRHESSRRQCPGALLSADKHAELHLSQDPLSPAFQAAEAEVQ